jgi:outer membrane phospholipase A
MKNNKIIFFDIGNIFFSSDLKDNMGLFERKFRLRKGSLYSSVHDRKWWKQFSLGLIKEKDYMQKVAKDYMDKNNVALNKEQLKIFLTRKTLNKKMIAYAKELKKKFRIGIICNTPAEWYKRFEKDIGIDIWVAYTQLAFWQLYNSAFSSPFRDTNYEPEVLVNLRTDYKILGFDGRFLNIGYNHQSNGRSRPLSRSWNRIVANVGFEKDNFNLLLKTWYRLPEEDCNDDNPDITRYMGYGELWGTLYWKKQRFAVMLRNNLRSENLGAVQLDWSFPLPLISDKFSIYVQYFNGYGESLLDYNTSVNRISAGFMLVDWN